MNNKKVNREELQRLLIRILTDLKDDLNTKQVAGRIALRFSGNIHTLRHNITSWMKGYSRPSSLLFMKYLETMLPASPDIATDDQSMKGMIVYEIRSMIAELNPDDSGKDITIIQFSKHLSDLFPINQHPVSSEKEWREKIKNERRWADNLYLYTRGNRLPGTIILLQIIYGYLKWKDKKKPIIAMDYRFKFLADRLRTEYGGGL